MNFNKVDKSKGRILEKEILTIFQEKYQEETVIFSEFQISFEGNSSTSSNAFISFSLTDTKDRYRKKTDYSVSKEDLTII